MMSEIVEISAVKCLTDLLYEVLMQIVSFLPLESSYPVNAIGKAFQRLDFLWCMIYCSSTDFLDETS